METEKCCKSQKDRDRDIKIETETEGIWVSKSLGKLFKVM
jgi:hypothetical protein